MPDLIYIEDEIADHPRTREICKHYPEATHISCKHYGEIFNRKAQNFRLQKKNPALILAKKHKNLVLMAPPAYGIGSRHNYYFSHMLNCVYDCRYCFLQGMYRSAHYVIFVNYEDFGQAITDTIEAHQDEDVCFFSGYDCDSLAYEPVTRFNSYFLSLFRQYPHSKIELRTKSTQIRSLTAIDPLENCIVAFSFTPEDISLAVEHGVPALDRRLTAMKKLQQCGWKLGLRFDPLIYQKAYEKQYSKLFEQIFSTISVESLHSVSLGTFRMPDVFYKNIVRLYPDEKLLAGPFEEQQGIVSYPERIERAMLEFCKEALLQYIPARIFYPCSNIA